MAEVPVNWWPALGTVLANEEVTNEGRSERGNYPVYKRPLRQWMLRITAYAERLVSELESVDWPEAIKIMQRNWIGRSEGAHIDFEVEGQADPLRVFTTRPDTVFGATYMVLAPEHPLVDAIVTDEQRAPVLDYRKWAEGRSEIDRMGRRQGKDGCVYGRVCRQPGKWRAHPDLDRRLCADGLRHRRHHGRAGSRRARLGVCRNVRPAYRPYSAAASRFRRQSIHRRRAGHQQRLSQRPPHQRG